MCKNILNDGEKVLGVDPGSEHIGWCEMYPGGHQFGELRLSAPDAWRELVAKILWADVVVCEEYRPREFLQGDGPKTQEVIGRIKAACETAGKPLVMVNHTTWRTRASNAALCVAMGATPAGDMHLRADGGLAGGHGDDAYWIAKCGRKGQ